MLLRSRLIYKLLKSVTSAVGFGDLRQFGNAPVDGNIYYASHCYFFRLNLKKGKQRENYDF